MVKESGKEAQTKPVEHHEEQKQRIPGQWWHQTTGKEQKQHKETPVWCLPDAVESPEVTL